MTEAQMLKYRYGQSKELVAKLVNYWGLSYLMEKDKTITFTGDDVEGDIPDGGILYLSHPYGGLKDNVNRAGHVAFNLQKMLGNKGTVISPVHNFSWLAYREVTDDTGYWEDMVHCLDLLKVSQVLVLAEGWIYSLGCCVEYLYAKEHHIPVYFYNEW